MRTPLRTPRALALLLALSACSVPRFEGPQVQSPPPGFTMKNDTYQQRRMFADREIVYHTAWVEASSGNFSGIYVNGHAGALGSDAVEAARAAAIDAARGQLAEFGELERLTVDGRTAWGWGETWRLKNGGLQYVAFRAAVPYDTITYAVEILTGDPGLKVRPDSLRLIAASFAVGRTVWNLPLLAIGAGLLLMVFGSLRKKSRARAEVTRRTVLVKLPPKKPDGASPAASGAPPAPTPAGPRPPG